MTQNARVEEESRAGVLERLGSWCAGHPWPVIVIWVLVLAGSTVANNLVGGTYSDGFSLPDAESGQGSAVLAQHGIVGGSNSARLVFTTDSGTLSSESAAIEQAAAQVRAVPHVVSLSDPLAPGTTAPDGRVAFANIQFDDKPAALGSDLVEGIDKATDPVRTTGIQVDYSGALGKAAEPGAGDLRSESVGIIVAILVLLLAFGSVIAAGLPIVTSVIGVATGLGLRMPERHGRIVERRRQRRRNRGPVEVERWAFLRCGKDFQPSVDDLDPAGRLRIGHYSPGHFDDGFFGHERRAR